MNTNTDNTNTASLIAQWLFPPIFCRNLWAQI